MEIYKMLQLMNGKSLKWFWWKFILQITFSSPPFLAIFKKW